MAGADGVDAGALQDLQLPLGGAAVHGGSQRAQVVVVADALNLDGAAVQQKALGFVEGDGADADRRDVAVQRLLVGILHQADYRVKIGVVDVPALRASDSEIDGSLGAACRNGERVV